VGATPTTTLPSGATIQIQQNDQAAMIDVVCEQQDFVVHLSDLLDACPIDNLGEIT
jgi:hypothetical protein